MTSPAMLRQVRRSRNAAFGVRHGAVRRAQIAENIGRNRREPRLFPAHGRRSGRRLRGSRLRRRLLRRRLLAEALEAALVGCPALAGFAGEALLVLQPHLVPLTALAGLPRGVRLAPLARFELRPQFQLLATHTRLVRLAPHALLAA